MKPIPGYEGYYSADKEGNIWSQPKIIECGNGFGPIEYMTKLRKLKPGLTNCGYHQVTLRKKGKSFNHAVHRLVGYTFLKLKKGLDINHKDGNKINNLLENLEVCTRSENLKHAQRIGLIRDLNGENHPTCKTPIKMKKDIELDIEKKISYLDACKKYGINRTTFYSIRNKKHWWYRS